MEEADHTNASKERVRFPRASLLRPAKNGQRFLPPGRPTTTSTLCPATEGIPSKPGGLERQAWEGREALDPVSPSAEAATTRHPHPSGYHCPARSGAPDPTPAPPLAAKPTMPHQRSRSSRSHTGSMAARGPAATILGGAPSLSGCCLRQR